MTLQPMLLNRDGLALDEAASAGQDRIANQNEMKFKKAPSSLFLAITGQEVSRPADVPYFYTSATFID